MPLPSPNLDDRTFAQLVAEARQRVSQSCPEWTDLSPGDPGWTLLELFAYLTETMIYRLNRLPEKAYIEFLRLMGVTLIPPTAASVTLRFSLSRPLERAINIPRGTRVTTARTGNGESPIFVTARTVSIPPGETEVTAIAHHCEWVEAEVAGETTGLPGLSVTVQRPPLIAPVGDGLDLLVGVETTTTDVSDTADPSRARILQYGGKSYRIWQEVDRFTNLAAQPSDAPPMVYTVDRMTGVITFAPAVQRRQGDQLEATPTPLAAVPPANRAIRLWYRRGGGVAGNVAAQTLTVLKDPIPGVQVTNPEAATGGRSPETLQNALIRGPLELHALERAVTASDFELLALRHSGAVARAKAITKAQVWTFAAPGTVEVLLVPDLPDGLTGDRPVTVEQVQALETETARQHILRSLDECRPLGTTCLVNWARCKPVKVKARIVLHRGEDPAAMRHRVLQRLYQRINPLVWTFGEPLRVDRVYDLLLTEPGVSHAEAVRFFVEGIGDQTVRAIAADHFQPHTAYAGVGNALYRTLNHGNSWEQVNLLEGEEVRLVQSHPEVPGLLAIATRLQTKTPQAEDQQPSRIRFSLDCGETWRSPAQFDFTIHDLTWIRRAGVPVLLLATSRGLYALSAQAANPVQLRVDATDPDRGFYAVTAATDSRGTLYVVVAAEEMGGVWLSNQEGKPDTFTRVGLQDEDVRVLKIQQDGPRLFLWAGVYVMGSEAGRGCFRLELPGSTQAWQAFQNRWTGGSCLSMAFEGSNVFAASFASGVQWLDSSRSDAAWEAPAVDCGLPLREAGRPFFPVLAIALLPGEDESTILLAATPRGLFRSTDGGVRYQFASSQEFSETVMLPETWLFCSDEHEIEVKVL